MMAILAPRAASSLFHGVSLFSSSTSSSPLKHLDNKILLRSASALAGASPLLSLCQKKGSPVLSSSPTSHVVNNLSPAKSSFHTSVFDRLLGNPGSVKFDLVPSEPRKPSEWEFRYVRYGKSEKEWRPKIPMGIPQHEHIPEGHVDRAGKPYTTEPLPWKYTLGKDEKGRRSNFHVGPGVRRFYRMVDSTRNVPVGENSPFVERVLDIVDDETRTVFIALVANGNFKRYILASENMKAGDLIKTHNEIPKNPVQAYEGDAYPIGALGVGTVVHNVETQPGQGGCLATHAGMFGTVLRKEGDRVVVSMFKKKKTYAIVHNREVSIDERCMATVGRVSNVQHHLIPVGGPLKNATMLYKLGYRARSGLFQKKDGRFGRRIRPPPDLRTYEPMDKPFTPVYRES